MVDLLRVYSKQSRLQIDPASLSSKAHRSRRPVAPTAAMQSRTRQLKPEEVGSLIAHYRENASVIAAASAVGVTRQTAAKHLSAAGISTVRRMTESDTLAAVRAYEEGQAAARIGRRLGFDPQTVLTALRKAYVPIRPRPGL